MGTWVHTRRWFLGYTAGTESLCVPVTRIYHQPQREIAKSVASAKWNTIIKLCWFYIRRMVWVSSICTCGESEQINPAFEVSSLIELLLPCWRLTSRSSFFLSFFPIIPFPVTVFFVFLGLLHTDNGPAPTKFTLNANANTHSVRMLLTTPVPFPLIQMCRTIVWLYVFTIPFVFLSDTKTSILPHCISVFVLTYG